ncbi:MAG: septal ring lytic transglycosylase RlpA family protein [Candidatus Binatia bacterium]
MWKQQTYKTIATRTLTALLIQLALTGLLFSAEKDANREAKKLAEKVKQKAQSSEKAEGSQNLVKDKVTVKKGNNGEPIVEQFGEASSYGQGFDGKKTATGEKFDQNKRTAAHPTLPLGTKATITNLKTGDSVDVKINDRGPYVKGRDIDVSKRAAKELGMTKDGVAPVKIEAEVVPAKNSKEKK